MIKNERELSVTLRWRTNFSEALDSLNEQIAIGLVQTTPLINQLHRDALVGIITSLDAEMEQYVASIRLDDSHFFDADNPDAASVLSYNAVNGRDKKVTDATAD